MKKLITAGVIWLATAILILIMFGCGPTYYLKRSETNLKKAIEKGATVKSDTTYAKRTFSFKGAETKLSLTPYILRKDGTKVVYKDTIIFKDKIKLQFKDNFIQVDCPPDTVTVEVPVSVDNQIKAGYTGWYVAKTAIAFSVFALVVGFLLGKLIKI